MKRKLALFLILPLLLSANISAAAGIDTAESSTPYDVEALVEEYVILVDASNPDTALFGMEKNADERCYPASTTKILTCIIALENGDLDDAVAISENAVNLSRANSKMGAKAGEKYTLRDLLYGLMLPSGNDAAIAIAEYFGGSVSGFAKIMNAKAEELGMKASHFVSPNGLHDDDHYTTARDMAVLTAYAMHNEIFREITATVSYTVTELSGEREPYEVLTTNRCLRDSVNDKFTPKSYLYEYCVGGKTGSTNAAGRCYISVADKDGLELICVLLGDYESFIDMIAEDADALKSQRFADAADMFDYAFERAFVSVSIGQLIELGMETKFTRQISTCKTDDSYTTIYTISAVLDPAEALTFMWYETEALYESIGSMCEAEFFDVVAPISAGQVVGLAAYSFNGKQLFTADLVADVDVAEVVITPAPTVIVSHSPVTPTPLAASTPTASSDDKLLSVGTLVMIAVTCASVTAIVIVLAVVLKSKKKPKPKQKQKP